GTDSMAIADEYSSQERVAIERAAGLSREAAAKSKPSRLEYLQALVRHESDNLLTNLVANKQADLEAFTFEGNTTSQLRKLRLSSSGRRLDPGYVAEQLKYAGQVTAL